MPEEVEQVEVDPAEGGQVATETEAVEQPQETYDYLEVEDPSVKYVKVKVDGEEVSVPLSEALNGYSRTEHFTRNQQALAEQRREAETAIRLQQALQTNPGLTMQILANQAGMSVEQYIGLTPAQQQAAVEEDPYADPLERAIAEERQARIQLEQRLEQREADERLERAVGSLKQTYKVGDEEALDVVRAALNMGLGPEAFPMIYQAMAYQRQQAQLEATTQFNGQRTQAEAQRAAAAQAAAQVVGTGTGATGTTSTPASDGHMSLRDAIESAFPE